LPRRSIHCDNRILLGLAKLFYPKVLEFRPRSSVILK
jgi:hypothetical protein